MDFKSFTHMALKTGRKMLPVVLMGTGTAMSIDALVKATQVVDESRRLEDEAKELKIQRIESETGEEISYEDEKAGIYDLTVWEKVMACWPAWVPVAWREVLALACFYGAFGIKDHRGAAIAAAYTLLEREKDEVDEALRNALGDKKYEEYRHERMNRDIRRALDSGQGKELAVGSDDALGVYYEPKTGKIFKADPRDVKKVVEQINEKYLVEGFVPLADFFTRLKINPPEASQYIGWQYEPGYGSIKMRTYDYYWSEKDIYITGLDLGIQLDKFVQTWY